MELEDVVLYLIFLMISGFLFLISLMLHESYPPFQGFMVLVSYLVILASGLLFGIFILVGFVFILKLVLGWLNVEEAL